MYTALINDQFRVMNIIGCYFSDEDSCCEAALEAAFTYREQTGLATHVSIYRDNLLVDKFYVMGQTGGDICEF